MLKAKIAVLVSGGGTNLQALIDAERSGIIHSGEITLVISNNQNAYALTRAEKAGIPHEVVSAKDFDSRETFNETLLARVDSYKPDLIVLDPPREGVRPDALRRILSYGAERIVYVSCQITSLTRDFPVIIRHGYIPQRTCSVDLFPYTTGIETVLLMCREKTGD